MIRAILIDAVAREVREVELPDGGIERTGVINNLVNGFFEVAFAWPTGDVLFVDEDGLRHDWPDGFAIDTPLGLRRLTGSGLVVGREVEGDEYPDGWTNLDPVITADEVRQLVGFVSRREG